MSLDLLIPDSLNLKRKNNQTGIFMHNQVFIATKELDFLEVVPTSFAPHFTFMLCRLDNDVLLLLLSFF